LASKYDHTAQELQISQVKVNQNQDSGKSATIRKDRKFIFSSFRDMGTLQGYANDMTDLSGEKVKSFIVFRQLARLLKL
jgi:hypothetical protein